MKLELTDRQEIRMECARVAIHLGRERMMTQPVAEVAQQLEAWALENEALKVFRVELLRSVSASLLEKIPTVRPLLHWLDPLVAFIAGDPEEAKPLEPNGRPQTPEAA